uniref:Uncharacterized protein n=1 Tax=Arundo donax TaxID=35708 RepID=A0A0A8YE47_ARUDO
MASDFLFHST